MKKYCRGITKRKLPKRTIVIMKISKNSRKGNEGGDGKEMTLERTPLGKTLYLIKR
jgi:hypothetical protein